MKLQLGAEVSVDHTLQSAYLNPTTWHIHCTSGNVLSFQICQQVLPESLMPLHLGQFSIHRSIFPCGFYFEDHVRRVVSAFSLTWQWYQHERSQSDPSSSGAFILCMAHWRPTRRGAHEKTHPHYAPVLRDDFVMWELFLVAHRVLKGVCMGRRAMQCSLSFEDRCTAAQWK